VLSIVIGDERASDLALRLIGRHPVAQDRVGSVMKRLLIVGALLVTTPVAADDAAKGGVTVALLFSECAGLYYSLADLGPAFGHSPDDVQLASELGNGAAIVAQYVLAQVRIVSQPGDMITPDVWKKAWQEAKTYIHDQVTSNRVHWRSRLRGSDDPLIAERFQICHSLGPLQAELVQEMRQKVLTAPWSDQ
jgi:hypothetical protein